MDGKIAEGQGTIAQAMTRWAALRAEVKQESGQVLRGIIAGTFWGAVIGGIILAMTSQLADWRDLTPAVAESDVPQDVQAVQPDSEGRDAPVVTAGTGAVQPESPGTPVAVTENAPGIAAPAPETAPPLAPVVEAAPDAADAPEASPAPGSLELAELSAAPEVGMAPVSSVPASDAPPAEVATDPALVPARLAPSAQDEIAALGVVAAALDAPDAPALAEPVEPDLPNASGTAAGAPPVDPPPSVPEAPEPPKNGEVTVAAAAPAAPEAPESPSAPAPATSEAPAPSTAVETENRPEADLPPAAPAAPTEAPPAIDTAEATPPAVTAPEDPGAESASLPQADTGPDVAGSPESIAPPTAPEPEEISPPSAPEPAEIAQAELPKAAPEIASDTTAPTTPVVRTPGTSAGIAGVRVRRFPTIGDEAGEAEASEEAEAEEAAPVDPETPALLRNAQSFKAPEGAALISVIALHDPTAPAEALPVPVTFALPTGLPNAAAIAQGYRAAGHEVVLVPEFPAGATAQDVEVTLSVKLDEIGTAVAMIDTTGQAFQSDRDATAQVIARAGDVGLGVITISQGFNNAQREADRAGVTAATVFLELPDDLGDRRAIARALDRAAFRARSEGRLIVLAKGGQNQLAGILGWALDNRDGDVALAPVSAVLSAD